MISHCPEQGTIFNRLTLVKDLGVTRPSEKRGRHLAEFTCICGNTVQKDIQQVKDGHIKSCGCRRRPVIAPGTRFGRLTIVGDAEPIRYGKKQEPERAVTVRCDCGKVLSKIVSKLTAGVEKSCGCLQKEWREKIGQTRSIAPGKSAFNALFLGYAHSAKKRDLAFSLTKDVFSSLIQANCAYCGTPPSQIFSRIGLNGSFVYNGIDRVDSVLGYSLENCVPCCGRCNSMKMNMLRSDFVQHIARIHHHLTSVGQL